MAAPADEHRNGSPEPVAPTEGPDDGLALGVAAWRRRPVLLGAWVVLAGVLLTLRIGADPALPAYLVAAVAGVTLAAVDLATSRLPDALVLPTTLVTLALLAAGTGFAGDPAAAHALVRGLLAALAVGAGYLVLAVVNPAGLGFGDVKLAPAVGLWLGVRGWPTVALGVFAGFALLAVTGLVLLAARRVARNAELPFGPFMLAGALLAVLAS